MEQYFSREPSSAHHLQDVSFELAGRAFHMQTDAGVFSRDGVDYGTALMHGCLPELSGRVLDLGCGWGALSLPLAAVHAPEGLVCADVNLRALELCRQNAKALGVKAQVLESDGFSDVQGMFSMIITNPPIRAGKAVYYPWFQQSFDHLLPGGFFACVVQKKQGAPSIRKELERVFGTCEELDRGRGYWVLAARKELS